MRLQERDKRTVRPWLPTPRFVGHAPDQPDAPARKAPSSWVPRAAGLACAAIGVINILSAVTPELRPRMQVLAQFVPGVFSSAAAAAVTVTGVLLLMLAHALRRRKRQAWRAVVTLLAASVVFNLVKGLDYEEATVGAALLVALLGYHRAFYAEGDPRSRWRAGGAFVWLTLASVAIGLGMLYLRPTNLPAAYAFTPRLEEVVLGLMGLPGPIRFATDGIADVVGFSLGALGWLITLTTAYRLFRPPQLHDPAPAEDTRTMRELLARHGDLDSLGYFSLRGDKSVIWSPARDACITYRVVMGVMLASGDPLGEPGAWPGAIRAFADRAARHAWVSAVIGCSERGGRTWARETGLDAMELGDEATIEVAGFTLDGYAMRNVRQMVTRVARRGYTAELYRVGDLPADELALLCEYADSWRRGRSERGFSMALGRLGDPADGDCVLAVARRNETIVGLLHFVPWGRDGLSLDLMRRASEAPPGMNEFLIVSALMAGPNLGIRRFSLNFAAFRSALEGGNRFGAGPVLRAWRHALVFASRWFQIESLYRFDAKFRPRWVPRFLLYPAARDLPRVALAALRAEDFIAWPPFPRLRWLAARAHDHEG